MKRRIWTAADAIPLPRPGVSVCATYFVLASARTETWRFLFTLFPTSKMDHELNVLFSQCHSLWKYAQAGEDDAEAIAVKMNEHYPVASGGERILIRAVFSMAPWLVDLVPTEFVVDPFRLSDVSTLDEENSRGLLMAIAVRLGHRSLVAAIQD